MADVDLSILRVLVVDDETFMRQLIVRLLSEIGIRDISWAENGAKALELVTATHEPFDLIVCDLEMPQMSGLEFVRRLRLCDQPRLSTTPVIILTGHSHEGYLHEAVSLSIHGFLTKPVSRRKLETRVIAAVSGPPIDPKVFGPDA
jgi:two-component system chemotaxis response regulator CheY